ncbi:MAG: invasion associated locus B family protein [Bauldia litoralis]|uniref:invasion associated locus B family protein n=1 Tax=Bauldia litoralis TaxID=665467 RepID=UPI0032981AFE
MANLNINFAKWQRMLPVVLLAIAAPTGAAAQEEPEQPTGPTPDAPWAKICNKNPADDKELCLTIQEVTAETGQFIASATVREITGDAKKSFVVAVPPGMLIQPGLRAQVDQGKQYEMAYGICFPNACYGELEVDGEFVAAMKRGGQLIITAMNSQAKPVSFPMTLAGFTKAYDSEGLNPAGLAKRQEDLTKALQDRAAAAREKLKEQQAKEGGAQ